MRTRTLNTVISINEKGYQSVKLYIPNDTLMGLNTLTFENNNMIDPIFSNLNKRRKEGRKYYPLTLTF